MNPIDIIFCPIWHHASCKYDVNTGNRGVNRSHHQRLIGLPRNPGECEKTRYHITHIARQADTIAALRQRFGWKAFVTNATPQQLSLQEAVLCYRNEYRVERIFNRLKSRVHIAPLFVKLNDQIE